MTDLPEPTKKPCTECPWVRTASPGHLGPHTAEHWAQIAHGDSPVACHKTVRHDNQDWSEVKQCAGLAIFRANIHKVPRNRQVVVGQRDTETVFDGSGEFIAHHAR